MKKNFTPKLVGLALTAALTLTALTACGNKTGTTAVVPVLFPQAVSAVRVRAAVRASPTNLGVKFFFISVTSKCCCVCPLLIGYEAAN